MDDDEKNESSRPGGRPSTERASSSMMQPPGKQIEDDEEDEEWEAASDFEGFFEGAAEAEAAAAPNSSTLVISLNSNTASGSESQQRARRKFTKEDIIQAATIHRSHLLCLLARGQMYDLAASHPEAQAAARSCGIPSEELQGIQAVHLRAAQLTNLAAWFQKSCGPEDKGTSQVDGPSPKAEESSVATTVTKLRAVAAEKKGTVEELVAVFVAVLRASGLLVRFVRALDPLPWRPTVRERHVPRQRRQLANREPETGAKPPKKRQKRGAAAPQKPGESATAAKKSAQSNGEGPFAAEDEAKSKTEAIGKGKRAVPADPASTQNPGRGKRKKPEEDVEAGQSEGAAASAQPRARSKGDLEFENQLAMAMLASANSAEPKAEEPKEETKGKLPRKAIFQSLQQGTGAAWGRAGSRSQAADCWAEVYCSLEDSGQGRWVAIHPLLGWIDKPELVENASVRHAQLAYVVAFAGGGAKDVTSRYISSLQAAEKVKKPNAKWWAATLKPLRSLEVAATKVHLATASQTQLEGREPEPVLAAAGSSQLLQRLKQEVKARAKREDKELQQKIQQQQAQLPTTVEGFRGHKHFTLQRHISRYAATRPGAQKAGLHRGEPYYHSRDVSELHTAEKWVQLGLEVTPEELGKPFKVVAKRGSQKAAAAAGQDAGDAEAEEEEEAAKPAGRGKSRSLPEDEALHTKLYGKWQTQPWQVPIAENGIVPKNERGTVLCPPLAISLPQGTQQIDRPRVAAVCRRLGVDFGGAMVGFDVRGGRSVPRFEGVVVCEEFAELVEAEWVEEQQALEEKAAAKRLDWARKTWSALLKALFLRMQLQEEQEAPAIKGEAAGKLASSGVSEGDEDAAPRKLDRRKKGGKRKMAQASEKAPQKEDGSRDEKEPQHLGPAGIAEYEEI